MNADPLRPVPIGALRRRIGQEIGVSAWHVMDQALIDRFAEVTNDRQYIHVDPARAREEAPFGGTIVHGFLTLSLLSTMAEQALPPIEAMAMGINYGFDRVRFLAPVPAGALVRARFTLSDVKDRAPGEFALHYRVIVEIDGAMKPALTADWITLAILGSPAYPEGAGSR
jgi:acyl dehydratase